MRFLILLAALLLTACGNGSENGSDEISNNDSPHDTLHDQSPSPADITVKPGFGVYSDILWVDCTPSSSNSWGSEHYNPVTQGDDITFQLEPGISYDFRCLDADLNHYYKWEVEIGPEGYVWEVDQRDPDNRFSNFTHQTFDDKDLCVLTVTPGTGAGSIYSIGTTHSGFNGPVHVEHVRSGYMIPPHTGYDIRLRAGVTYTIMGLSNNGNGFTLPGYTAEHGHFELAVGD